MSKFTQEYLNNKLFVDQTLAYDAIGALPVGGFGSGKSVQTGVFPQENGDVLVRMLMPSLVKDG